MNSSMLNFFVISSFVFILTMHGTPCLASVDSKAMRPLSEWTVGIVNELGQNQVLFVHCKSKDDDLGDHNITSGQTYKWQFKENMTSTTLFWCTLRTPTNQHASFEVFWREKSEWLASHCNFQSCLWYARDNGIYLLNIPQSTFDLIHNWEQ